MLTLGIETSCDETAASVVKDGQILSNEISSSVELHSSYGGVVPEIASRYHTEYIYPVVKKALDSAGVSPGDIGLIAATKGPGLPGSLLVGISFAKAMSMALNVPIVEIDHVIAHIFSCFADDEGNFRKIVFPFTGAVVSGGHTSTYFVKGYDDIDIMGKTLDDAAGEAFDKVSKLLGMGYPGGGKVEQAAAEYSGEDAINFPRALLKPDSDLDLSFSGIKTAVMYYWKSAKKTDAEILRICYSFQEAVVGVLVEKFMRAVTAAGTGAIAVGGGVVNNNRLRDSLRTACSERGIELFLPPRSLCSDNAAMIAFLGEKLYLR